MIEHEGPGHGDVTLSLTSETKDGGMISQGWTICECTAGWLRTRLGPPQDETIATADAVKATARAALNTPGAVHRLSGGPGL